MDARAVVVDLQHARRKCDRPDRPRAASLCVCGAGGGDCLAEVPSTQTDCTRAPRVLSQSTPPGAPTFVLFVCVCVLAAVSVAVPPLI